MQMALQCRRRKGPIEYYPVIEDVRGTYIFNSKDLCDKTPRSLSRLVSVHKNRRQNKGIFIPAVTGAYRKAIDAYMKEGYNWVFRDEWLKEIGKASHRLYTTGFYFGKPGAEYQNYDSSQYIRDYDFTGLVKSYDSSSQLATVEQRNKMSVGDEIEISGPGIEPFLQTLDFMTDENGIPIEDAPHAQQILKIRVKQPVSENYMVSIPK